MSSTQVSPADWLPDRRQHWFMETGLHDRREVTCQEEATRMTKAAGGRRVAPRHNLVLALIKRTGWWHAAQARRWFAGHSDPAAALLTTPRAQL